MRLIRACFLVLAIVVPASWTIAHAAGDDSATGGSGGGSKSKKKGKKKDSGDSGDKGGTEK
jgi:hypothetical protein